MCGNGFGIQKWLRHWIFRALRPRRADSLSLHYYTTLPSPAQEKLTPFSFFLAQTPKSSFYYIPCPPLPHPTAGSSSRAPLAPLSRGAVSKADREVAAGSRKTRIPNANPHCAPPLRLGSADPPPLKRGGKDAEAPGSFPRWKPPGTPAHTQVTIRVRSQLPDTRCRADGTALRLLQSSGSDPRAD